MNKKKTDQIVLNPTLKLGFGYQTPSLVQDCWLLLEMIFFFCKAKDYAITPIVCILFCI